jgi:hypothetical protein
MGNQWWLGNWWTGAVTAPPGAALPLEEKIRNLVVTKLATITIANGYNQNATVDRPPVGAYSYEVADCPKLVVRSSKRGVRAHLRRAEEFVLEFRIICIVANSGGDPDGDLAKLMADVRRLVYTNRRWHNGAENLARRSWIPDDDTHETEVEEETLTSGVSFNVLARSSQTDLSQVKDV